MDVGGIRVSHMSHLDKRLVIALTTTRGKRAPFTVEPLTEPVAPTEADVAGCVDQDTLRVWWNEYPGLRAAIEARVAELKPAAVQPQTDDADLFEAGA